MQISKEEIPIIKSGLEMKKKTLGFKLKQYKERLKKFEEKYGMSTVSSLKSITQENLAIRPTFLSGNTLQRQLT